MHLPNRWITQINKRSHRLGLRRSVGYIDLSTWTPGVSQPTGVIYTGITTQPLPDGANHWSLRGIDVAAGTGTIAVADMGGSLLRLTRRTP